MTLSVNLKIHEVRSNDDIEAVILLAAKMHELNAPHLDFDPTCIRRYYEAIKRDMDRDSYNCFIAYVDNKPAGFLVCIASEYFFSRQICARQELWYVDPLYRNVRVSFELMRAFEEWARLRGAVEIITGVMIVDEPERAEKIGNMLTRMGYPKVGSYHTRALTLRKPEHEPV